MKEFKELGFAGQILSEMPSGVLVVDEGLRIALANEVMSDILGADAADNLGRPLGEVLRIEGISGIAEKVIETGQTQRLSHVQWANERSEIRHGRISLSSVSSDDEGLLLVIVEDTTDVEELRKRAQESERGFRDVIEHSPDCIAVHRDEKFLYLNPAFLRVFGAKNADELIGTSVYEFVHPDERPFLRDRVRRMLETGEHVPVRETTLLKKDGTKWVAELTGRAVIFDGQPAIASMARDITEKRELAARMMQMDRMIAAGTLAAGVGHEINNPLTYVMTNLDYCAQRLERVQEFVSDSELGGTVFEDISAIHEALGDAKEGSDRIRDIVRQLSTFSPAQSEKRREINIEQVIGSVLEMISNETRHRAQVVLEFGNLPVVYGNANKLAQVFLNLLINAAHAIEEGAARRNEIRISGDVVDSWAVIEITDTGAGISPAKLPRIFDPFFTTKYVGQGTGLGLYICQRIVKAHEGRIEVESEVGRGSTFRVLLPLVERGPDSEPKMAAPATLARFGARVMVIDDEPMIGRIALRILDEYHDVETFISARSALEYLAQNREVDVILCDLMMPDMTGMDFYRRVERDFPDLLESIVFITGGAFTPRAWEFIRSTSNLWIEKPFETESLLSLVAERVGEP